MSPPAPRGRSTALNPHNRFQRLQVLYDEDPDAESRTELIQERAKSILSENDSPDIGFRYSLNAYRGCEHGCSYCYARPSHEYLGFSAGLDFETKIIAKMNAAALLREALMHKRWQGEAVVMSGNTDCYQPLDKRLGLTRDCLKVFAEFRNPVSIITKSQLIRRDLDVLQELARHQAVQVFVSLTSLDNDVAGKLEPRAARPQARLETIHALSEARIPVGVMTAPIIAGLNDHESARCSKRRAIMAPRARGGRSCASPNRSMSCSKIGSIARFRIRASRVIGRIRECRDGAINDTGFYSRMRGSGQYAQQIAQVFSLFAKKYGLDARMPILSSAHFQRPSASNRQLALF